MTFECDVCPSFVKVKSCVSNGKYCPYAPKSSSTNEDMVYDEIEIMKENLLEKCLYQHIVDRDGENVNYKDWFNYMISMREDIEKHSNVEVKVLGLDGKIEGSKRIYKFKNTPARILKKLGYSKEELNSLNDCVKNSFKIEGDTQSDNDFLKTDREWQNLMRVTTYPSVTINN